MGSYSVKTVTIATLTLASCTLSAQTNNFIRTGFYLGANTGAGFVTAQQYNEISNGVPTTVFRDEASARGYHGAVFAGYNFHCDCRFVMGIDLSADGFSNRGRFTQHLFTEISQTHFQESFDLNYAINLTVHPGWKINDCAVFYGIFGYSNARLEVEAKNLLPETAGDSPVTFKDKETLHGFVVGAGLLRQMTCHVGVFAAYQYTYYGNACITEAVEGTPSENPKYLRDRSLTLDTNVFKMGVVFTF